jgi:hypothetical protein
MHAEKQKKALINMPVGQAGPHFRKQREANSTIRVEGRQVGEL